MTYLKSKNTAIKKPKILIVAGPTASGKTTLGIELAKQFKGEIISADSRQVYRGLDIGSAKVSSIEQDGIPHHLLDVADISYNFSVNGYIELAEKAINEIVERNKVPIIVGGTGFYIDTLLNSTRLPHVPADFEFRARMELKSTADLYNELQGRDPIRALSIDPHNKVRLIRALEIIEKIGSVPPTIQNQEEKYDYLYLCLKRDHTEHVNLVTNRIHERWDAMVAEVHDLLDQGVSVQRLNSLGLEYRYLSRYIKGVLSKEQAINELDSATRKFIKRQYTWWKRNPEIVWMHPDHDHKKITEQVSEFLSNN